MNHRTALLISAVIGGFLASPAPAAEPVPVAETPLQASLDTEETTLRPLRQALQDHFQHAYTRYPSIPAGTLEAIAFVQSRWMDLRPDPSEMQGERHHHMPAAHGPMGLYDGDGFADQVTAGARLLGASPAQVRNDPRTNVLAAAALLDHEIQRDAGGDLRLARAHTPESIRAALMRYVGYAPSSVTAATDTEIGEYARASFAYDVLLAQDRGVDDRGIKVPERPIEWERAFDIDQLIRLRAPFVRLDVANDRIETSDYVIDPVTETLRSRTPMAASPEATNGDRPDTIIQSTDYGPALWVASPYHRARSSYSSVTIHTAQGSYGGTISWFQNNPYSVSAHYVIRSSDGQVTQMVRNSRAAHHVGVHNGTTLGIEHEGYVNNSSWYTNAMYNSSAALVRDFCAKYAAISCANAYSGPAHSGVVVLSTALDVKGHQHYSSQTHTDPGINWNWGRYYDLLNPGGGGGGGTTLLDSFEGSVGHFNTSPTYSGSTTGISSASSATRTCTTRRNGNCSLRVLLKDNTGTSANWAVRLLSGSGSPSANVALSRDNGEVGFWVYAGGSGMSVAVGIDDSDGTERSVSRSLPANTWTYVSWSLADAGQWNAWAGGNGAITASTVKLDAIWLYRAQTAYDVNVYIDDVQINN